MIIYMYSTCTGHTVLYYSYQADHINILCIIITTIITIYTVGIVLLKTNLPVPYSTNK
jgi:hypothetical protein